MESSWEEKNIGKKYAPSDKVTLIRLKEVQVGGDNRSITNTCTVSGTQSSSQCDLKAQLMPSVVSIIGSNATWRNLKQTK
jgi:hypothetical protein